MNAEIFVLKLLFNRLVYVWGYNGYCRLGLGNQVDVLRPKVVPQFAGPNEPTMGRAIAAGPTNSIVVDKQGMFWMAGKVSLIYLDFQLILNYISGRTAEKVIKFPLLCTYLGYL